MALCPDSRECGTIELDSGLLCADNRFCREDLARSREGLQYGDIGRERVIF
jgi:hypothetical protein